LHVNFRLAIQRRETTKAVDTDRGLDDRFCEAGEQAMNFQRAIVAASGPARSRSCRSCYMNWKTLTRLKTVQAFVESSVFADAVAACEKVQSTTPFKWNGGKQTAIIGLNSVKPSKDTIVASYTLFADSVYCDYDPIRKKADIGSNFLERESF